MVNELAKQFGVSRHTIQRIWREAKRQYREGQQVNVQTKKAGRVGRKRMSLPTERLTEVPRRKRTTLRSLAIALNMCKSTLHKMVNRGEIRTHTNPIKPELTFTHKYERMQWCVKSIIPQTIHTVPRFHLLQNLIHVDEKWFMMSKLSEKYYLSPEECDPYRVCRSKRYIVKIMFLAAWQSHYTVNRGNSYGMEKLGYFHSHTKSQQRETAKTEWQEQWKLKQCNQ
ncbi:Aminopeptidase C [Bienertia sinuspersici]